MTGIGSPGLSLVGPRWMMPTPRLYLPMSTMRSWRSGGLGGAFFRTLSISSLVMSKAMVGAAPFCADATVLHADTARSRTTTLRCCRCICASNADSLGCRLHEERGIDRHVVLHGREGDREILNR